jgi:hypothetical protein
MAEEEKRKCVLGRERAKNGRYVVTNCDRPKEKSGSDSEITG